jgi:hypothetical protein
VEAVGVGRDLRRYPRRQPHQGGRQRPAEPEHTRLRLERAISLWAASGHAGRPSRSPERSRTRPRRGPALRSGRQDPPRACGPAGEIVPQVRLGEQFLPQAYLGHVGRGELVGDGHPVCRAQKVQLHPVDAKGTPPNPPRSRETGGLGDLPRVQRGKQGGVDQQGLPTGSPNRVSQQGLPTGSPNRVSQQGLPTGSPNRVSGSPRRSPTTARLKGSRKRRSFLTRRWNEEGASPSTPGNRGEKNLSASRSVAQRRAASRKKERSLSTPRSCSNNASAMTSEYPSRFMDSWHRARGLSSA